MTTADWIGVAVLAVNMLATVALLVNAAISLRRAKRFQVEADRIRSEIERLRSM